MLEEFMGIPVHPLLVHATVVFVPLLALLAMAYALVPVVRLHTRWVLGLLAIATPLSALLTKLAGDALYARFNRRHEISADYYPKLHAHRHYGTYTLYASIGLAVVALALVYYLAPRAAAAIGGKRYVQPVLQVLSVVAAGIAVYYVVRTGDSGSKAVWTGK